MVGVKPNWVSLVAILRACSQLGALEVAGARKSTAEIRPTRKALSTINQNNESNMGLVSPATSGSKRSSEPSMELSNTKTELPPPCPPTSVVIPPPPKAVKREGNNEGGRRGLTSSSEQDGPKTPDPKAGTLRRLAQNREAARKSRELLWVAVLFQELNKDFLLAWETLAQASDSFPEPMLARHDLKNSFCVPPNYMASQLHINEKIRGILIDWLIEVLSYATRGKENTIACWSHDLASYKQI
ncbi:hypothetical protein AgCh_021552 [Apium graveolens]